MVGGCLLITGESLTEYGDRAKPLDLGHPIPAGDDEPDRETMLRGQWLPVHGVREQDFIPATFGNRKASLVLLLDIALDASIESGEYHIGGVVQGLGLVPQRPQPGSCPFVRSDCLLQPGLAERAG